ncbi:MAG: 50S ribosomal protein L34e [Candidatus Thorarchaeota archaeon]|nr:50S ribosomal protein L34e [Candidatus Thorarchaeota archaeon]
MPRPGQLTRGRANRKKTTPGGRHVVHREKFYSPKGRCPITGTKLNLPKEAKHNLNRKSSKSSKRPNRPYGGVLSPKALRRLIKRQVREQ